MAHQAHEHYSASNPVPKLNPVDALKRAVRPKKAEEHNAQKVQEEPESPDKSAQTTGQLERGKRIPVIDPVTGEHTTIQHADESPDKPSGDNILDLEWPAPAWSVHYKRVTKLAKSSILTLVLAYNICFLSSLLLTEHPSSYLLTVFGSIKTLLTFLIPNGLAYILNYRLEKIAKEDFEDRYWDAERKRGLRAGRDEDGDGSVETSERIKVRLSPPVA